MKKSTELCCQLREICWTARLGIINLLKQQPKNEFCFKDNIKVLFYSALLGTSKKVAIKRIVADDTLILLYDKFDNQHYDINVVKSEWVNIFFKLEQELGR